MARKRTKKEARERIRSLPEIPVPPVLGKTPVGRAAKAVDRGSRFLAERLVAKDPLDRLAGEGADIFGRKYLQEAIRRSQEPSPTPSRPGGGGSTTQRMETTNMANTDEIIDAFLKGVQEGAQRRFGSVAEPENFARIIGRRAVGGRARTDDLFNRQFLEAALGAAEIDPPKKRKRSKYNRELARQLKILRKEKPRTPQVKLMKEAHKRTRKALGMGKRRRK